MVFYVAFLLLLALISALLVICPCLVVIGQVFNMLCVFGISLKSSFEIFYLLLMKLLVCSDYFFFYSVECWESHGLINSYIWFWDIHLQFWFTKPSWFFNTTAVFFRLWLYKCHIWNCFVVFSVRKMSNYSKKCLKKFVEVKATYQV